VCERGELLSACGVAVEVWVVLARKAPVRAADLGTSRATPSTPYRSLAAVSSIARSQSPRRN
jgi:hypothetical protein